MTAFVADQCPSCCAVLPEELSCSGRRWGILLLSATSEQHGTRNAKHRLRRVPDLRRAQQPSSRVSRVRSPPGPREQGPGPGLPQAASQGVCTPLSFSMGPREPSLCVSCFPVCQRPCGEEARGLGLTPVLTAAAELAGLVVFGKKTSFPI